MLARIRRGKGKRDLGQRARGWKAGSNTGVFCFRDAVRIIASRHHQHPTAR